MQEQCDGIITEVKKFATHDGPGIRTTVFLKGCPLRCSWCSNPETMLSGPELFALTKRCHDFGACVPACPQRAISRHGSVADDHGKCDTCGVCVEECVNKVFQVVGRAMSVYEVMNTIRMDRPFYRNGGGAILCGGEPLFQPEFALAILAACRNEGIGTVLDTSGFAAADVAEAAARHSDMVLLDIKHMDPEAHRRETGVDNRIILENARRMAELSVVRISVPLVPGFNDSEENLRRTADFSAEIGAQAIDINPMHSLGSEKYRALGKLVPYERFGSVDMTKAARLAKRRVVPGSTSPSVE